MATKRPIVLYAGSQQELATGDSVPQADAATRATTVQATDNRILKPSDFSPSAVAGIPWGTRSWFSSKTGMETGTAGTDYGDVLSLSNYTDASGGLVNALFMSKGGAALYHYQGTWNGSTWNAPKQIAYTDSAMSGNTSGNAATATKLATTRAFSITGAVTGTATNFDGTAGVAIPVTAVDLTSAAMSGLLGVDHGSTGQTTYTVGDMLYASGTTALSKLAAAAVGNVLRSGGAGVAPAWGKVVLTTDVSGTLPAANGGTGQAAYTVGDILYASTTTALSRLAAGTAGMVLTSNGAGVAPSYASTPISLLDPSKMAVRIATTTNDSLTGLAARDGVTPVAGDRVLVWQNSMPLQNGIFVAAAGAWFRATDADTSAKLVGAIVSVEQGTVNAGKIFQTNFKSTDVLGLTGMTWREEVLVDATQTLTNKTLTSPAINGNTVVTAANFTHTNAGPVKHQVVTGSSGSGNDALLAIGRTATDHAAFLQWEQAGAVRWQMGLAVGDTLHNLPLYYYDASNVQQLFAYFTRGGTARFYPAIEASGGVQTGSSATAAQNFTLRVDGAGAFKISRGNTGATTADPISIDPSNNVTTLNGEVFVTGDVKLRMAPTANAGWIVMDGSTIGNTGSGATRANVDTQALFTLWWSYTDAQLPIFTSAGGASTRGASAAADWSANKRLTVFDARDRVPRAAGTLQPNGTKLEPTAIMIPYGAASGTTGIIAADQVNGVQNPDGAAASGVVNYSQWVISLGTATSLAYTKIRVASIGMLMCVKL